MIKIIKKLFPNEFKSIIKAYVFKNNHLYLKYRNDKKVFVFLIADYGNLGDVAISRAQQIFLKNLFKDYVVIGVPISKTFSEYKSYKEVVKKDDIITIIGGGNTSQRYSDIEFCRQFIIKKFKNNKIITFPQSIELDNASKKFVSKFRKTYENNKNLLFLAREEYSYTYLKRKFPGLNLYLSPDIVLSLSYHENLERDGIVISLRKDKEKLLNAEEEKKLIEFLKRKTNEKIKCFDTQKDEQKRNGKTWDEELDELIKIYQSSKLVITDRLHGMIISYITNTPCIVFNCDNRKIAGCYEWLKESKKTIYMEKFDLKEFEFKLEDVFRHENYINKTIDFEQIGRKIKEFIYEENKKKN